MDRDTIIKLAREAGFWGVDAWFDANANRFARFAELAAALAAQPAINAPHALGEAVAALYFADSSDYKSALWTIVRDLGGDEATELLERDESAAFHRYAADRNAAPAAGATGAAE